MCTTAMMQGGSQRGEPFRARLSGDIHSAGSIVFYVLSGGAHCFGEQPVHQQPNIMKGKPTFEALRAAQPLAVDLVARMVRLDATQRAPIARVLEHPLWWDAAKCVEKISGWKTTWRRGSPQLEARLGAHARSVRGIVGKAGAAGWLARLDGCVAEWLEAETRERGVRPYDGRQVLDLLRAIRNSFEHWLESGRRVNQNIWGGRVGLSRPRKVSFHGVHES